MLRMPQRNKTILAGKIRHYMRKCFPGKGSGIRLAEEIGTTPQTISNWLNGSRLPTLKQMYRLAKAFDVSPFELCGIRKKHTRNQKTVHLDVLTSLLQHCENDIARGANPRITRKFLLSIKGIIENDLREQ